MTSMFLTEDAWLITYVSLLALFIAQYLLNHSIEKSNYSSLHGQQKKTWKTYTSHPRYTISITLVVPAVAALLHAINIQVDSGWGTVTVGIIVFAIYMYVLLELAFLLAANVLLRMRKYRDTRTLEKHTGIVFFVLAPMIFFISFLVDWALVTWAPVFLIIFGFAFYFLSDQEDKKKRKKQFR
ncbi:hypothetical protein ACE1TF_04650 [Geomicrobium sp. JSM 1781026]|uniref:hypothetical protein n=1 Tax=Geomicrobium sp. JSM 1781026 TaxID=3344580 RepID=UPI0035C013CE